MPRPGAATLRTPHNGGVEPDELPEADDLWWSWVALAALDRAAGARECRFDPDSLLLRLDGADGSWLRMQRLHGSRAVLWGRSALAPPSPADARRTTPDWALTEATGERRPTFVAWHVHGEWDLSVTSDEGVAQALRPLLTVDPRLVELVRSDDLDAQSLAPYAHGTDLEEAVALVRDAGSEPRRMPTSVRMRLRDQIHDQMRDTVETDRQRMRRPPVLVQWLRASGPSLPFEYAVMVVRGRIVPSPGNTRIPEPVQRSLNNVLRALHQEEADEHSGAWLFGRVVSDGVVVGFDRAYDGWPEWYRTRHRDEGPALEDLAWEMRQRSPHWCPAWATLLPVG